MQCDSLFPAFTTRWSFDLPTCLPPDGRTKKARLGRPSVSPSCAAPIMRKYRVTGTERQGEPSRMSTDSRRLRLSWLSAWALERSARTFELSPCDLPGRSGRKDGRRGVARQRRTRRYGPVGFRSRRCSAWVFWTAPLGTCPGLQGRNRDGLGTEAAVAGPLELRESGTIPAGVQQASNRGHCSRRHGAVLGSLLLIWAAIPTEMGSFRECWRPSLVTY
jgi:hypothetical protein